MNRIKAFLLCAAAVISMSGFAAAPRAADDSADAADRAREVSPDWVETLAGAQEDSVTQLLVVACDGMDKTTAVLTMHERTEDGEWEQILTAPAWVGRNGLCPDAERFEGCTETIPRTLICTMFPGPLSIGRSKITTTGMTFRFLPVTSMRTATSSRLVY